MLKTAKTVADTVDAMENNYMMLTTKVETAASLLETSDASAAVVELLKNALSENGYSP